jgi:hypothetical protein
MFEVATRSDDAFEFAVQSTSKVGGRARGVVQSYGMFHRHNIHVFWAAVLLQVDHA